MTSNRSCSRLVLGKLSDGVISNWMRWRKIFFGKILEFASSNLEYSLTQHTKSYLFDCPVGYTNLIHHPQGDADHRGECKKPTNGIAPPRVHILIIVLQRGVFNEGESKGTL